MNVLFLTTISGFLPKFLMQDVEILQKKGYKVHYASNFNNPIYECDRDMLEGKGISCHSICVAKSPYSLLTNWKALRQLNKLIDEYDIQAILCHNPVGGVLGRLAGTKSRKPYVIYTAHGFHFYEGAPFKNWLLYYPVEKFLAAKTDQIITINHEDKKMADSFRLKPGGTVSRIPGVGLDANRFKVNAEERHLLRRVKDLHRQHYVFVAVGELNDNKNHRVIIEAFARLQAENVKLYICGEGNIHAELEGLIRKLNLTGRVELCGYQKRIEEYLLIADCFLFPSIREGLGMAAIEAMACGLPLIVADSRGTREYARPENAIVCQPQDQDAFCRAMDRLCRDKELSKKMGQASVEISKEFSLEETGKVMKEVYQRMEDTLA